MPPQQAHSSLYKGVNITIPLDEYLIVTLGDFYGSMSGVPNVNIPDKTALILEFVFKDSQAYKIVWTDGKAYLWHFNAWMDDQERQRKLKEYSEKLRVEGWIKTANREMITRAIRKKCPALPEREASSLAARLFHNITSTFPVLQSYWGIKKLIETEDELP